MIRSAMLCSISVVAACAGAAPARSTAPAVPTPALEAAPARAAAPPPPVAAIDCGTAVADGTALRNAGKLDEAAALLERAVARCGSGHGLHNALGVVRAQQHRVDAAAGEFIAELRDPHTVPQTFANLHEIYRQLSDARKLEIAGLGATDEAPIKVPTIRFEYAWVGTFGCPDGPGKVAQQALVQAKSGSLDLLRFTCPDGKDREAYFDYSDDPDEKAMMEQLKEQLEGAKPPAAKPPAAKPPAAKPPKP